MRIRYAAKTDPGLKRNHNEDYFSLIEDEQLFLVADGMGGHACGEVASKMAADVIREFFARSKDDDSTWPFKLDRQLSYLENRLVVGIKMANQRIFEAAAKDARLKGMGTTVVIGMIAGDKLYIAHVGDSRLYRLRRTEGQRSTRDVRPTDFTGVPRVWERLKAALEANFAAEPPERRAAIQGAIAAALTKV